MNGKLMDWLSGLTGSVSSPLGSNGASLAKTLELRQIDEIWECTVRRVRAWVNPPEGEPSRPWIILTASGDGRIRGSELVEHEPTPAEVIHALVRAMRHPVPGSGGRHRPSAVYLDNETLVKVLAPQLEKVGIECVFRPSLRQVEAALQDLWDVFEDPESIGGLLDVHGVTPFLVKGVFEAAASFYRAAPWYWVSDADPIEIHYPVQDQARYAVVLGHGGEAYGVAIYNSVDVLLQTYSGTPMDQMMGEGTWTAMLFGEAMELPFDDLDALETYGWPVAGKRGYPLPLRISLSGNPVRPGKSDLLRIEAALLAIPRFVSEHMEANEGAPTPAEETLTIDMADGMDHIHLRYPVPELEMEISDGWLTDEGDPVHKRNVELMTLFEEWLSSRAAAANEAQVHLKNARRFAFSYLGDEGGSLGVRCAADEATPEDLDEFLGDWLPYRTDRALVSTVDSHITSLTKLYTCLRETEQLSAEESGELLVLLQGDRDYYLSLAKEVEP